VALDPAVVGSSTDPHPISWDSSRAILYALGVGAGTDDSLDELAFVTENTEGVPQLALPTFAVVLGSDAPRLSYGDVDKSRLVHAFQEIALCQPVPVTGSGTVVTTATGVYDKGSGALVTMESTLADASGTVFARIRSGAFIRGAGGFGGDRGPSTEWSVPDRAPDAVVRQRTLPWQALLYRLSGDRNPLHSDPAFAARGGFDRPILHGLCTYGFVGRAVLHAAARSDPSRIRSMSARFSAPVMPGQTLETTLWRDDGEIVFATTADGIPVLTHGRAEVIAP
jgi:acyl dehydratase